MPAKNAEDYIEDAILRLNSLPGFDIELIVVNDSSTDNTRKIVQDLIGMVSFPLVIQDNPLTGKVEALNYGYSLSKGDLIKCIDADDALP
jgi:glycosyltransferase involved in cell wall biosynthesis